jgi:hypothetical protein
MGFWTNKDHRTAFNNAEDLAYSPTGGRIKMWLLGVGLALIPVWYGVHCLFTGHARLFGHSGSPLELNGSAAKALAISYIAIGGFIHAHWFWGLQPRFEQLSYLLKVVAVLVFLCSFGYTIYRVLASG